jgi:hypothetical protein
MMLLETITAGICAYVIFGVLMQPGMLLAWYGDLVHKWHNEWPDKWRWLAKPLGYCGACFAGQIGWWWFLFLHDGTWSLFQNGVFALQTIFFFLIASDLSQLLKALIRKYA